ncbi:hypothetical protein [Pedosphaera parvula]|uniref:Uncharacterized protein n=1 Tax=Pedosphaera parvula (strain Ellin514) TaxID=320771 RepID=B9XP54_PEDPL|nr:hypothetical protein [Pedosphaera parvula]EEF58410.1 hypothetical protein Cflav_PD6153 [Pedosphaera parvula Ellin514]
MVENPDHPVVNIEGLVVLGIFAIVVYAVVQWLRRPMQGPPTPNPWPEEVETSVQAPDALPLCHRCFTPQDHNGWFCPKCGTATGPYNNLMPYLYIFSQGEVLRAGVMDRIRPGFVSRFGFILFSFAEYFIAAPLYLYFFLRNLSRQSPPPSELQNEDVAPPSSTD